MRDVILLHPTDSVCVAARDLVAGETVELLDRRLQLLDDVMQGHKIARTAIQPGEAILKWGQTIGFATCPIECGQWVHTQNMTAGVLRHEYEKSTAVPDDPSPLTGYTFQGYRRADGRAGSRNSIPVLNSVNCSASVARFVAERFTSERLRDFPNLTGVLGSVENLYDHKNHDVMGEYEQAQVSALAVVGAATDVRALATFDHRHDRFDLRSAAIGGAIEPDFHESAVTAGRQLVGGATVLGGNDRPDAVLVAGEFVVGFGIVTGVGRQLRLSVSAGKRMHWPAWSIAAGVRLRIAVAREAVTAAVTVNNARSAGAWRTMASICRSVGTSGKRPWIDGGLTQGTSVMSPSASRFRGPGGPSLVSIAFNCRQCLAAFWRLANAALKFARMS